MNDLQGPQGVANESCFLSTSCRLCSNVLSPDFSSQIVRVSLCLVLCRCYCWVARMPARKRSVVVAELFTVCLASIDAVISYLKFFAAHSDHVLRVARLMR